MTVIHIQNLMIEVEGEKLLEIQDLRIEPEDRIGLVGMNGSGKTTLLRCIAGEREPDQGRIRRDTGVTLLPQIKRQEGHKSGGELSRDLIYRLLREEVGVLLADEPTTHLDVDHVRRLEEEWQARREAMVIVSHDRAFLDALCNVIWEIRDGKVTVYRGDYSTYQEESDRLIRQQDKDYAAYLQKKRALERAVNEKEVKADRATKKPKHVSGSEARITGAKPYFAKKQKKLNQGVKAIESRLDQLEKVDKRYERPPVKMAVVNEAALHNRMVIRAEETKGTAGDKVLWEEGSFAIPAGEKVGITGPNGCGKTTLLNRILNEGEGITVSKAARIGYFSQMLDVLDDRLSILENVKSTSQHDETLIRTVLARLGFFRDDVHKPIPVLSGGERVKVVFAKLFTGDHNVLILDEPTNFLDIEAVTELEALLNEYPGTILLVSHDRRVLEHVATAVLAFDNGRLCYVPDRYSVYADGERRQMANRDMEEERMKLDNAIADVLSRLSMEPTDELNDRFQALLKEKRRLISADDRSDG